MPEILRRNGWKMHFYATDGKERPHIHCRKGEKNGKFFLLQSSKEIIHSNSYNMNNKDISEVLEIVNENYHFILEKWEKYFKL
ncbi:MAG: DUF4160 domain-containing protein [Bacteroidota bacterium]|nr:DUF4160 domain-containing protein [Bacteroidota bacterium]